MFIVKVVDINLFGQVLPSIKGSLKQVFPDQVVRYNNVNNPVLTSFAMDKSVVTSLLKITMIRAGSLGHKTKKNNDNRTETVSELVEPLLNNNDNIAFALGIEMLTKALYHHQRRECASLELDPTKFEQMIETINPQLEGFFSYMTNSIIPKERSAYSVNEAKKSIVGLCYTIAGLRNKFVNQYKLEVGLYLMASGAIWEAVNTMAKLGYSACANMVEAYRKQVKKEHLAKIEKYFLENINVFYVYNIDDYHAIHENRRPDTVSTSTANHFATCVANPIVGCSSVPIVFNNILIHNPENVEASRICWYLINRYTGMFDTSYLDCQLRKISQGRLTRNNFDPIEILTVHNYADNIEENKEVRSTKELQLMGFNEQHLHSVHDYINVLNLLLSINNKTQHLNGRVAPIVADWPGQIFIRKALYMRTQSDFLQQIESFLPILGPLHLARNGWTKIRDKILENFGPTCKDIEYRTMINLLDNLVPEHLSNFNEYYVENVHSKIRANISQNATTDNIIKQAYVIMNHNNTAFKDNYCKKRRYPYTPTTLNFLSDKTVLFLLQHFQDVFNNCGKSFPKIEKMEKKPKKKKKKTEEKKRKKRKKEEATNNLSTCHFKRRCEFAYLPIAYSTAHPYPELCDRCGLPFINNNGVVFVCGHGYHLTCYDAKYIHCEEFYKKGIFKNVKKFLEKIEKGANTLTNEDLDDDDEDDIEGMEETIEEVEEPLDITSKLLVEIKQIKYW
ncbi:hypothetical protein C2G38_2223635 [Gigaspora rosea]|uniref:Uncharacterized protein n=1 Tax=Gigaspora rosea TaxID=44941 RepID=A0A397UA30_9GLOM|nr:hypothetical protein C2G38_2223635 [Gigaspora rosea]